MIVVNVRRANASKREQAKLLDLPRAAPEQLEQLHGRNMKMSVRVKGEWMQIPCKDGSNSVRWLGTEAILRWMRQQHRSAGSINGNSSTNATLNAKRHLNTNGNSNADGKTNGSTNGSTNGHTNGHANGHTSGHANGHTDGSTNGHNNADGNDSVAILPTLAEIRKARGSVVLDLEDIISEVLDDNDFVIVVLACDERGKSTALPKELRHMLEMTLPGHLFPSDEFVFLDGCSLLPGELLQLGKGACRIKLSEEAEENIGRSRRIIDAILKEDRAVYGVTTGVGNFANTRISADLLEQLQYNVLRSHAAGVGKPLSPERTRMLLALRINVLAKGFSGISLRTLHQLVAAFNASCLSWVPEQGSVGASGDLAPLAHLALGLVGEGRMWSPETGWDEADKVLKAHGLTPLRLGAKEGVALINGTQLITALGAEAVERAANIAMQADVVAALTLEVLKGTCRAFDADVHKIRPHPGQIAVARRLRALLHSDTHPSQIAESHRFCERVQDAYTLRCCPQVHGVCHDAIAFAKTIISTEINSGTDNPIVFSGRGEIISAGNFHGEYPAKALDFLAIAVHEIAAMSERRIERMVNPALSGLPAFLTSSGGLNSGFMLAHCTAAALVSENKVLCHPSSVDSLSTSAGTEDHVSMGGFSARKALQVVENVERVVAIELLAACQALEFLRPLRTTEPLEELHRLVRTVSMVLDQDRFMAPDIDAVTELLVENKVWETVKRHIDLYCESNV